MADKKTGMTPEARAARARLGGLARAARMTPAARAAVAKQGFDSVQASATRLREALAAVWARCTPGPDGCDVHLDAELCARIADALARSGQHAKKRTP